MRDLIRRAIDDARRSEERIGAGPADREPSVGRDLAATSIRLARLATSIHLAETARMAVDTRRERAR